MKWSVLDGCSSRQHTIKSHLSEPFGRPCILIGNSLLARIYHRLHPLFCTKHRGVETIVLSLARGLREVRTPNGTAEFDLTLVTETPAEGFDDRARKNSKMHETRCC